MEKPRNLCWKIISVAASAALLLVVTTRSIAAESSAKEKELIGILQSDAAPAEKAITCKHLAVHGSEQAVPELAKLLANEQLASWARIPLEVIPGPAADDALRAATESLEGKLLVGVINSIGVRRDAKSVETLAGRLKDKDPEVAAAAAVALGKVGGADAVKALREALKVEDMQVRSAVAEGCVLCAERLHAEGASADAVALYDEVRQTEVPKPRIQEATRGAILARNDEGIPLLIEQLRSQDKGLMQIALSTAREFPGNRIDRALADELASLPPERAALAIQAMADRPNTVILPAIVTAASAGPKEVRVAAINAVGRVGDASSVAPLLEITVDSDQDLSQAAKNALGNLPGAAVDKEISSRLGKSEGKLYVALIELVGQRRIDATNELIKALESSDKAARTAALAALGNTVPAEKLSVLIAQATSPKNADDAQVARQALKVASIRMPDREATAGELAAALQRAPSDVKPVLLDILAAVGGKKALETVAAAARSDDPALQDVSTRLLGEWMTIDAAPVLLDLAKAGPAEKFRGRALRGYIRIARQFVMPDPQRAEMCEKAFDASNQPAEQKLVLDIVKRYPSQEMMKVVNKAMKVPALKEDAAQAADTIAKKK